MTLAITIYPFFPGINLVLIFFNIKEKNSAKIHGELYKKTKKLQMKNLMEQAKKTTSVPPGA